MKMFKSNVPGFIGECSPTWINKSELDRRTSGYGYFTGFFKIVKRWWIFKYKSGREFHGKIINGEVHSTILKD